MISLRNVSLEARGRVLLDGVSFDFEDGKAYGLLGPNGAGKTTLMKAMLGLVAHSGKVLSDGRPARSGEFGSLIEYPAFYPRLTARENLELHVRYLGICGADVMPALAGVGLAASADVLVTRMSLGMRQRLGIARACLGSPRYLLLDEPTNGLDPLGIKEVRELVRGRLCRPGRCAVISSHNLPELAAVSDELVFVRGGRIVASAPCFGDASALEALYEEVFAQVGAEGGRRCV